MRHGLLLDGENKKWKDYSREEKIDFIIYLLEQCELVDRNRRCQAMRAILYLIQGNASVLFNDHIQEIIHEKYFLHRLFQGCSINARMSMKTWPSPGRMFFCCIRVMLCISSSIYSIWNWLSEHHRSSSWRFPGEYLLSRLCHENNSKTTNKNLSDNQEMRWDRLAVDVRG